MCVCRLGVVQRPYAALQRAHSLDISPMHPTALAQGQSGDLAQAAQQLGEQWQDAILGLCDSALSFEWVAPPSPPLSPICLGARTARRLGRPCPPPPPAEPQSRRAASPIAGS